MTNKTITLSLLLSLLVMALAGCSESRINTPEERPATDGQSYTLRITAGPSAESRAIIKDRNSKGLLLKWNKGMFDLNIAFVQDGKVKLQRGVEVLETLGEYCTFEVTVPKGIDPERKFDLYGVVAEDLLRKDGGLMVGVGARPLYDLTEYSNNKDGYVPVYFRTEGVSVFDEEIKADFEHLGSMAVVTVKNTSDAPLHLAGVAVRPTDGTSEFYHAGSLPFAGDAEIPYLNIMDLTQAPKMYKTAVTYPYVTIAPGQIQYLGFWFRANTESTPEVSLVAYEADGRKAIVSTNSRPAREEAMQAGKAYNLYAEWTGKELTLIDPFDKELPTDLPTIKFELNNVPKDGIYFAISAANQAAESTAWIDLNGNDKFDFGEAITDFQKDMMNDPMTLYKPTSTTVTIHGEISGFAASGVADKETRLMTTWLTSLEVSEDSPLKSLTLYNGVIKSVDLSGATKLEELEWVANGTETITLPGVGNRMQSLIISSNPGLKKVDLSQVANLTVLFLEDNGISTLVSPLRFNDLWIASIKNNQLDKGTLENFMGSLNKAGQKLASWMYSLDISGNPGSATADTSVAQARGWSVTGGAN